MSSAPLKRQEIRFHPWGGAEKQQQQQQKKNKERNRFLTFLSHV